MICKNCGAQLDENAESCVSCGITISPLKLGDDPGTSIFGMSTFNDKTQVNSSDLFLVLENGVKFDLKKDEFKEISIGRKDIGSNPIIDLGPYDNGPYISRNQGIFIIENNTYYFKDLSKNGTILNNKKLEKNSKIQIKKGDKFQFGKIKGEIQSI